MAPALLAILALILGGYGIREMLREGSRDDGESGLLVPEGDDAALAAAMKRLAEDATLYRQLAERAAERVRERFDLTAQTEVLEKLYDEARERHAKA